MTNGIYVLGNDVVCDQVVALLNSIEANYSREIPVCILPYDDRTEAVAAAIANRPQVSLFDDREIIDTWDRFSRAMWDAHPTAQATWQAKRGETYHRFGTHRRYCGFDGPFERFVYMDADTLLLASLDPIFDRLERYDFITYDFQHKDLSHVFDSHNPNLTAIFPAERLEREIFCSGFYGSKRGVFPAERREQLLQSLQAGDSAALYIWAPDQTLLNYMVMRSEIPSCNLALTLPPEQRTGCSVTSPHFQERDRRLYDKDAPLTYLHYIGIPAKVVARACAGENLDFPYRELFLHYRYLHAPEQRPAFAGKPKPWNAPPSFWAKVLKKVGLAG